MRSDPVTLLDRQYERLVSREDAEFVNELRRFHDLITAQYGRRLVAWARSPFFGLLGGAFIAGLVTQLATGERAGRVAFLVGAVALLLIPRALGRLPSIRYTRASAAFIALAVAAVVVALAGAGLSVALLVFAALVAAFVLRRHA